MRAARRAVLMQKPDITRWNRLMRVYAQKLSKPQQEPALQPNRLTEHSLRPQATLGVSNGGAEPGEQESVQSPSTGIAHDFSKIPVYSQERAKNQMSQPPAPAASVSMYKPSFPGGWNRAVNKCVGGLDERTMEGDSGPAITPTNSPDTGNEDDGGEENDVNTPPKLTKQPVGDISSDQCGSFKYDIRWELDKPTKQGGLVVQQVEWKYDVNDCEGNKFDMKNVSWFKDYKGSYWEAWPIRKGQKITTFAERGVPYDDEFSAPSLPKTVGSVWVTGTAGFYEGMTLPAGFKITNKPPAGALPMSWVSPTLTGGTGTIPHSFGLEWGDDCCK